MAEERDGLSNEDDVTENESAMEEAFAAAARDYEERYEERLARERKQELKNEKRHVPSDSAALATGGVTVNLESTSGIQRVRELRARKPGAFLCSAVSWFAGFVHDKIIRGGRGDVVVLRLLTAFVVDVYERVSGFFLAHCLFWVSRSASQARARHCTVCPFRQSVLPPFDAPIGYGDYCGAERDGAGCACPRGRYWPFSSLGYKLRLRNFTCPLRHFGRFS